jgi:hypothetical protein
MTESEDDKFRILERLIYLDGGVHPITGKQVIPKQLWLILIDDELRSLNGVARFDTWDKMGWCKAPVKDEANT